MSDSILDSVKKVLNLPPEYDVFDQDLILHINSVFSTLSMLGIGPSQGFMIEDSSETWSSFLGGDTRLNHIKTYICLRVRLLFDPPTTSYLIDAMDKQIKELEWRINAQREDEKWTPPLRSSSLTTESRE
jgi:hypothetical protein